jgi:hypothetical protein
LEVEEGVGRNKENSGGGSKSKERISKKSGESGEKFREVRSGSRDSDISESK